MPNEVVTTPSTVTVLSANFPGLVLTSEMEREPMDAHAPETTAAAKTRVTNSFFMWLPSRGLP